MSMNFNIAFPDNPLNVIHIEIIEIIIYIYIDDDLYFLFETRDIYFS